jgi:hypothetical protein
MSESEQQTENICWMVYPDPTDIRKRDELERALSLLCTIARNELLLALHKDMEAAGKCLKH